jgi:hypothetical protein
MGVQGPCQGGTSDAATPSDARRRHDRSTPRSTASGSRLGAVAPLEARVELLAREAEHEHVHVAAQREDVTPQSGAVTMPP